MNLAAALAFALVVIGAALALAQLWFAPWAYETFLKLVITDAIALGLIAATAFFLRERRETKQLREDKTLR